VSPEGPGDQAGIKVGDIILGVGGDGVRTQAEFYRKVWDRGAAGTDIPLRVLQGVDVTNRFPVDVGHAVSIRFYGSAANADVRAESIQSCLGLRSTMLKLAPF